ESSPYFIFAINDHAISSRALSARTHQRSIVVSVKKSWHLPLASKAFIASRKALLSALHSSKMKQIFSLSTPTQRMAVLKSSLKSSMP
ncbi:hypothetical protein ACHAXN_000102, partial [Cyclotella atomus]